MYIGFNVVCELFFVLSCYLGNKCLDIWFFCKRLKLENIVSELYKLWNWKVLKL